MLAARLSLLLFTLISASSVHSFVPTSNQAFVARTAMSATASSTETTEVKVGDKIPAIELTELVGETRQQINLAELVSGKKVAIFGVPGAFTPGCSKSHLPSFMNAQAALKEKGVEMTICLATNDPFVMEAWGRTSGGADAGIRFLSDSNGELTKALGLAVQQPAMLRMKRFSLIAENGVVTRYFDSNTESSNTWAPNVLAAL